MAKRKYTQRKRAQQKDVTRRRIVEATMELHEELGAARTTVSAVAEQAGVQRLTVYRHFPDEAALLDACTSRWLELNPLPGADEWDDLEDPVERLRTALRAFHAYYGHTRKMWESSYRDRDLVPALQKKMDLVEEALDETAESLVRPLGLRGNKRESALVTVRQGLRFLTWLGFRESGVKDAEESADLVVDWVSGRHQQLNPG